MQYRSTRKKRYRVRWSRLALVAGLIVLGFFLLTSAAFYGYFRFGSFQDVPAAEPQGTAGGSAQPEDREADHRHTVLVMGTDAEGGRTDTMILISVNKDTKAIGALWIPRDTRALIPGRDAAGKPYGWDKINAANAYWTEEMTGHARAMQAVSNLLNVRVDDFVLIRLRDFERIVDTLGGVTIDVPFDMDYDDPYQDFHVHLKKGSRRLNGSQALGFVRWRHNNDETIAYQQGDIGRIGAQQQFATALLKQALQARTISKLPTLIPQLSRGVKTSMDLGKMLELAQSLDGIELANILRTSLPGKDAFMYGGSYWINDPAQTQAVVDWVIRFKAKPEFIDQTDPKAGRISITKPKTPPAETPTDGTAGGAGTGDAASGDSKADGTASGDGTGTAESNPGTSSGSDGAAIGTTPTTSDSGGQTDGQAGDDAKLNP